MKTLEEVCNEMPFESPLDAHIILHRHYPNYTFIMGDDGNTTITDSTGEIVATIKQTGISFEDL